MNISEIVRSVFLNIYVNKFRVFLTSLGIIMGAVTIILVAGIGKGTEAQVAAQFGSLNAGTIVVMNNFDPKITEKLSTDDAKAILEQCPSIADVTITINGQASISYNGLTQSCSVVGVYPNYQELNNLTLQAGEFITEFDNTKHKKIAVIGSDLAAYLFEDPAQAVGARVTIAGRKYEVAGVLKRVGSSGPGMNVDQSVMIPYAVAQKMVLGRRTPEPMLTAIAKDIDHVASGVEEIGEVLKANHGSEDYFRIMDAGSRLSAAQESARTMSALLIAVASIVLLVGGIGIMNVMFVSVNERTKEIGILKAIGASKRDILMQFLLEAVLISVSGGIVGTLLSFLFMPLMKYLNLYVVSSVQGVVLALAFCIATGTFFGYYPAAKAASLQPIDALRAE